MKLSEMQSDFLWMVAELLTWAKPFMDTDDMLIKVTSWTRSPAEQLRYFNEGKSKTLFSKHLKGLAVDFAILKKGKFVTRAPIYALLGARWEQMGGVWGGNWKFNDIYHFEYNKQKRRVSNET